MSEWNNLKFEKCSEKFVKSVFEKVGMVDVTDSQYVKPLGGYRPDFIFLYKEKKYCIEVKKNFSNNLWGKILEKFNEFIKSQDFIGILVILDKVPDKYKKIVEKKYNIKIYDISNILYMIFDDEILQKKLNGLINFSLDNIIPEKTSIEVKDYTITYREKNEVEKYIAELNELAEGTVKAKDYERLMEKILKNIFSNELSLFKTQCRTEDGINIFDMICKIKSGINDDFFTILEKYYKTKYILFEFKNYSESIKQGQICTTEKYLFETALRKVAIIITRKGIDKNGMKLAKGILRESGKLIIVLNDNDIKEMIRMSENGEKATVVLERKLDGLLTTLEK